MTGARTEEYSYDENGNRTMAGYVTSDLNQLLSDGVYDYEYDLEGNMISKTRISDGEVTEYMWDYRQRLVHVVVQEADEDIIKEVWYTYDVFDRRIGVVEDADGAGQNPATERWTVYDGDNAWADFDDTGSLTTRYLYGPAIDQIFARIGESGDVDWYLTDHLGSVRQIVQTDGTILDEIDYDSFGQILNETNPANGDRFKYTAREWDAILGQYHYRARYYGADIGRFYSEDPLRFEAGDSNLYRYVANTPTNAVDPTGLESLTSRWWQEEYQRPRPWRPLPSWPRRPPNAIDRTWSQQAILNYVSSTMRQPPEIREATRLYLVRLFQVANETPRRFSSCTTWAATVNMGVNASNIVQVQTVQWEYYIGVPWTNHWLGHMAVMVTLPDGTVFYLDNGWWGNSAHIFGSDDIGFVVPYHPERAR